MASLPLLDGFCLVVFCAAWLGYGPAIHRFAPRSINVGLVRLRVAWMRTMLNRQNRITDAALLAQVMQSATFFASTSLLVIGALLSLLSNADRLQPALESLAFVSPTNKDVFELKMVLPLAVLMHGFVKLTWSMRQLKYVVALIGAAPEPLAQGPVHERLAGSMGLVMSNALSTFNDGFRSYYFAIAGLAWLISPGAMALTALALAGMLVWRQLASPASRAFEAALAATLEAHAEVEKGRIAPSGED